MTSSRRAALALSIAAILAVPASAQAGVGGQLSKASNALGDAVTAAKRADAAAFRASARANNRFTAKAARKARKASARGKRARLVRRVAAHSDRSVDKFAGLIDAVPADLQGPLVNNLSISAELRAELVDLLLGLADRLPEPARSQVIEAVTRFQTDGELEDLFTALTSSDVIDGVKGLIRQQLASISDHLDAILAQFEDLTGVLPPHAGQILDGAIAVIQEHLAGISEMIGGLLGGDVCDLFGGLPFPVPFCD